MIIVIILDKPKKQKKRPKRKTSGNLDDINKN